MDQYELHKEKFKLAWNFGARSVYVKFHINSKKNMTNFVYCAILIKSFVTLYFKLNVKHNPISSTSFTGKIFQNLNKQLQLNLIRILEKTCAQYDLNSSSEQLSFRIYEYFIEQSYHV